MRSKTIQNIPPTTVATATFNGPPIPIGYASRLSAQFTVVGATTPSATGKMQVSNDVPPSGMENQFVPTNWSDLPNATIAIAANGTFLTPPTEVCARWARSVFVFTSGTGGTVGSNVHALGVGGVG